MRSWDFFDTLLGRACGDPWRVFELMGGEEFKLLRQQAEQKSDKTFEGIYASLKQITGWSAERVDALRAEEYAWEQKLAFPIHENVSRVSSGDLVITDTYFSADQIRDLAGRLNLPPVEVIATYGGKHRGEVWRSLRTTRRKIVQHVGDNKHADFDMARRHGFHAVHYNSGAWTGLEKTFTLAGHWDIAALARCVRMQNPYSRSQARWLAWNKQANYNVPFLLLCAARLQQYVQQHRHKKVWFLSRDTCLLQRVFSALYPDTPVETFYASRQTYLQPSESFIEYAKACLAQPGSLFVDLQGTGKSLKQFCEKTKLDLLQKSVFCVVPHNLEVFVPRLYVASQHNTTLEVFNYDTQGRVLDVRNGQPVRAPVEYTLSSVEAAHEAIDCLLKHVFRSPTLPEDSTMQALFRKMRQHAPGELLRQHQATHPIIAPPKHRD